jgi:protein CMS1
VRFVLDIFPFRRVNTDNKMSRTKKEAPSGARSAAKKSKKAQPDAQQAGSHSSDNGGASLPIDPSEPETKTENSDDHDGTAGESEALVIPGRPKRDHDEFETDAEKESAAPPAKKKYKSKAERMAAGRKPADDGEIGTGDDFDPDMAQMDPSLLADHVAKAIKRHYQKDTTIELDERYLPGSTFTDTTGFKDPRTKGTLCSFLEFLVAGNKSQLTSAAKETARPHTLLLCQAGIRAADLARVLRPYESNGNAVVKLFAKHFKIEQQAVFLRKNKTGFGVGTPHRVKDLITTGGLKLDNLERIVIDGSYLDEKKLGIWGHQEVFKEMLKIFKMEAVSKKIEAGDLKVVVF